MAAKLTGVFDDVPRWKVALAIGAPVALGVVGVWYGVRCWKGQNAAAPRSAGKEADAKTPLEKAMAEKNRGNVQFKSGAYEEAIKCYTQAIEMCPQVNKDEIATFYQNRAAAHEQLKHYDDVRNDCTSALQLNNRYTKALTRRARACEKTQDLMQCLEDLTAACILESFQNMATMEAAERVLKQLGKEKAAEAMKNRSLVEPSKQHIRSYFSAFSNDPIMAGVRQRFDLTSGNNDQDEMSEKILNIEKNSPYMKALEAFHDEEYASIPELVSGELALENSSYRAEALLFRATFSLIYADNQNALQDFNELLNMSNIDKRVRSNALIKRGSLRLQLDGQTDALDDLAAAIRDDPENSDIYHHRGQLNLLIDRVDDAVKDFQKSVTLSPNFAIARVQKCYTEYRQAFDARSPMQLEASFKEFEKTLEQFPGCAEGYTLYGQALCDQQRFQEADDVFEKATKLEPDNANNYVHRGLLALQWQQDSNASADLIMKALEVDDKCEFAYETLGTIEVQRGNMQIAIGLFERAISLAKTELEMAHLYSLRDAAIAQGRVAQNFGINIPT